MCGDSGYCFKFSLFCGKEQTENRALGSLGEKPVMHMLSIVESSSSHIIFYYFFTSHSLLHNLQEKGFRATGIMRDNRTETFIIKSSNNLDKMTHYSYDYRLDEKNETTIVRRKDNKSVAVMTNFYNIECSSKVQRWLSEKNGKVILPQSNLINNYNKYMGGVDHHNWLLEKHSIGVKGIKWYWYLFT